MVGYTQCERMADTAAAFSGCVPLYRRRNSLPGQQSNWPSSKYELSIWTWSETENGK